MDIAGTATAWDEKTNGSESSRSPRDAPFYFFESARHLHEVSRQELTDFKHQDQFIIRGTSLALIKCTTSLCLSYGSAFKQNCILQTDSKSVLAYCYRELPTLRRSCWKGLAVDATVCMKPRHQVGKIFRRTQRPGIISR